MAEIKMEKENAIEEEKAIKKKDKPKKKKCTTIYC